MISRERISKLAARKGVKAIAVENFLSTLQGMTSHDANANLAADARSYKWNAATVNAIRKGIDECFFWHTTRTTS